MNNIMIPVEPPAATIATPFAAAPGSLPAEQARQLSAQPAVPSSPQWRAVTTLFFALILFALCGVANVALAAEMVNLNKADAAAMQQNLLGIGPIKAESIVSYRKKNGKFKNIDDLLNVSGIGPALLEKNKRYLSLSKGAVSGDAKKYAAAKKQAKAKQSGSTSSSKSTNSSKSDSSKTAKKSTAAKKSSDTKTSSTSSKSKSDSKKSSKKSSGKDTKATAKKSKADSSTAKKSTKSKAKKAKPAKKPAKKSSSKSKKCNKKTDKNCSTKKAKKKKASTT